LVFVSSTLSVGRMGRYESSLMTSIVQMDLHRLTC